MFRRKEDSLFDNASDSSQESVESATVVSSPAAPGQPASVASPASSAAPSYAQSMPRPPVAPSQPQASSQPATSFRPIPSAPIGSDLSRNRMPEAPGKVSSPVSASASSSAADKNKSSSVSSARRVLTVGNDILLKGEIATCDRLVIEGKVEATLNDVHTVEISEHGSFKGSANIEDAEIRGLFEGDLIVRNRLVIYATGKVRGKITYGEIEIERGGEMTGEIKTNASAASGSFTAPRARQAKDDKVAA